ncbi:MAG: putative porin, partial [Myxococcota bacterium]
MRRIPLLIALVVASGPPASAEENPAVVETLAILRERGLIDEAKQAELLSKNQQWETAHPALLPRLEWSGDMRGRLENFWYEEDPFGVDDPDRNRGRYRLRLGARAKVNEAVTAGFMLASGDSDGQSSSSLGCDNRGTNRSFGTGSDFNMDTVCIDQAYVELAMPKRFLPEGMTLKSIAGKQANPFLWKVGKDILIWDNDITPEGVAVQLTALAGEQLSLFGNAGYFVSDENFQDPSSDPHVTALQGGLGFTPH